MKKSVSILSFLAFCTAYAQDGIEVDPPDNIKTIVFKGGNDREQFPIALLGTSVTLTFDDLNADNSDYYYRIKHFNHDWKPSALSTNEFMKGFEDIRIADFQTSINTLQRYTHYRLQLPNEQTRLLVSGNYLLEIYDISDEIVFSRRFCIYEERANVQVGVFRPQKMDYFTTHQTIHFSITPQFDAFKDPAQRVRVALLQNYQWDSLIEDLKPQYYLNNTLEYRYEEPALFEAGNEYLYFDNKNLQISTVNISYVNRSGSLYETHLFSDTKRNLTPYTYAPDINGDFKVRNVMGTEDSAIEADYSWVYFSLIANYDLDNSSIYIYGKFNNYSLTEANRMYYNPALELYEGVLLLKQGFYNYKYVIVSSEGLSKNAVCGSHAETENEYLVLVYYRDFGGQYDALISVGRGNSFDLQN